MRKLLVMLMTVALAGFSQGQVVDAWNYDGLTNGAGFSEGVSTGLVGGASFTDDNNVSIQDETAEWVSFGDAGGGAFKTATPSDTSIVGVGGRTKEIWVIGRVQLLPLHQ